MKQRILALLLAAGLCLGLIAAAPALAFSDVSGEELSEAVEVLSGLGIVSEIGRASCRERVCRYV